MNIGTEPATAPRQLLNSNKVNRFRKLVTLPAEREEKPATRLSTHSRAGKRMLSQSIDSTDKKHSQKEIEEQAVLDRFRARLQRISTEQLGAGLSGNSSQYGGYCLKAKAVSSGLLRLYLKRRVERLYRECFREMEQFQPYIVICQRESPTKYLEEVIRVRKSTQPARQDDGKRRRMINVSRFIAQ